MEVDLFLEATIGRPLKELNMGRILNDVLNIAAQYQLSLPSDLLLLVKALTQVEGLGLKLDPDFDLLAVARPFIRDQYRRRYQPRYWIKRFSDSFLDFKDFLEMLPSDLKPLYNMLRSGRIKSEFNLDGLEEMRQTIDRSSYRLSFAVVLASLVIGSSIVIHANIPPPLARAAGSGLSRLSGGGCGRGGEEGGREEKEEGRGRREGRGEEEEEEAREEKGKGEKRGQQKRGGE